MTERNPIAVSILIPCFNKEKYIERAIKSAQSQTLRNIEILVVDDRSSDGSVRIVDKLRKQDKRIRLIRHNRNAGTHITRATGVAAAKGEYILSLDPDDELLPNIAMDAYNAASESFADVVEFMAYTHGARGRQLFNFKEPPEKEGNSTYLTNLFANQNLNWNLWKRLIKKSTYLTAIDIMSPYAKRRRVIYAEDKLHMGAVFLCCERFVYISTPGYIYYTDNPENSESGTQQSMDECLTQLRFVEIALKSMYQDTANITYLTKNSVPDSFKNRFRSEKYQILNITL